MLIQNEKPTFLRTERGIDAYPDFDFEFNLDSDGVLCKIAVNFRYKGVWKPVHKTIVTDTDAAILAALIQYMDSALAELDAAHRTLQDPFPTWTQKRYKDTQSHFLQLSKTMKLRLWSRSDTTPWDVGCELLANNRTAIATPYVETIRQSLSDVRTRAARAAAGDVEAICKSYRVHRDHLYKLQARI